MFYDCLTKDNVSVASDHNGIEHRKAYINSTEGRAELIAEVDSTLVNEILVTWGGIPTVTTPVPETLILPLPPTSEERLSAVEAAITALMGV